MLSPANVALASSLPPRLAAGDSLQVVVATPLPPGSGLFWVLTAQVNGAPNRIRIGGLAGITVANDGSVPISLVSTDTAAWLPGTYDWTAFAVDGNGNREAMATGSIEVLPDPAGAPVDVRSYNERMLAQVRALRAGKALDDVSMYKVGTRELTHYSHAELTRLEAEYEARVRKERRRAKGLPEQRSKYIQFGGCR